MPAPTTGPYLLVQADDTLTSSRVFASTPEIQLIDSGPGANLTLKPSRLLEALTNVSKPGFYGTTGLVLESAGLTSNGTIEIVNPDGGAGNPILKVIDDMTVQKLNVAVSGTLVTPARPGINFIVESPLVVDTFDDAYNNQMDITISSPVPSGGGGGTVYEVDITSSSGLVISGSNPATVGDCTINIDLPSGGSAAQVLTYTQESPYTIGWTTPSTSGDVTAICFASTDNSMGIVATNNPLRSGSGSFTFSLNSWSTNVASSNIDCANNEIKGIYSLVLSDIGGSVPTAHPCVYQNVTGYANMNMTWGSASVNMFPILCEAPPPPKFPSDTVGFATAGALLFGNGVGSQPVYTQLLPNTASGIYKLKINTNSNGPYWSSNSSTQAHTVQLADTSVPATGTGDPIDLGGGSYFVEDPNITSSSVVLASGVSHYDGSDEPAVGPLSVRLNPTTGSGQLPVGYILYGDPTFDNGKKVSVSVVVY